MIRTGLSWDPATQTSPNFNQWDKLNNGDTIVNGTYSRGLRLLPSITTKTLPTDDQWSSGLTLIVSMLGPNGIYQKGGSYTFNGKKFAVVAHPNFPGITDYELWNEPNGVGSLNGTMTPATADHLVKVGSLAVRSQAARMGFVPNVIGFAIGGIDLPYLQQLYQADPLVFTYIDTLSMHAYMKNALGTPACSADPAHCVTTFTAIRSFLDTQTNGTGARVHLGTTEGGYKGSADDCRPPSVLTLQQQQDYSTQAVQWVHNNPLLNFDFWMTFHPVDDNSVTYSGTCTKPSHPADPAYQNARNGVMNGDLSLKPWGTSLQTLATQWRTP